MELAIPLVAFGGLYVISNQKKNKETFKIQSHTNEYTPSKQENKHFIPPQETENMEYTDLAGRKMNIRDQTANMVPFFGKQKNIGNSSKTNDVRDSTLDNYTGAGSMQISKTENAPLFKPQDNIQWASGSPNQSDFFQSRVNPSTSMHNVKPFQEEHVGPGMNHGYSSEGSGGFNAGMEARSQWLPKTVNDLRVVTNPKETFELATHQGPAQSKVNNLGSIGKVEKYLPDKYFVNTPDRYFTTTGEQKGQTLRSIQPDPTIHRATTTKSYAGIAGNSGPSQQPQHGMYRLDHRQELKTNQFNPASITVEKNNLSNIVSSIELLPNNRTTTKPESFTIMKGLVNAITAPITDILRPTRKETFGLTRVGALASSIPQPSLQQQTKIPSTIKESTIYSPYTNGQRAYKPVTYGGYQVSDQQPITNQRDSTSVSYMGISGSTLPQTVSYEAEYNSMIKSNRANEGRIAGGNTQMFAPIINQQSNNVKSSTHTPYSGIPQGANYIPNIEQFGGIRTPQSYNNDDRNNSSILEALKENPYNHSILNKM
jgi:hypothetical protein